MNFGGEDEGKWKVNEDETVVVSSKQFQAPPLEHNWTATIVAICVISFVLSAVTMASLLLGAEDESAFWSRVPYDLHDVLEDSIFINNSVTSDQWKTSFWISEEQFVYWDAAGGLSLIAPLTNHSLSLVPPSITHQWQPDAFWPSYDGRYILLRQPIEFLIDPLQQAALYAVYDTQESYLIKLRMERENLQAAVLSQAMWLGHSAHLAIIYRNNIYWTDNIANQSWQPLTRTPTTIPLFINGMPDWTYSEGIAQQKSLMWPSEDGQWLVYGSLNTSGCHQLGYIDYQEDQSDANSIRYSIPGGPLPRIELKVIHVQSQLENYFAFSENVNHRELLLVQMEWVSPLSVVSVWMTRDQNQTSIFHCSVAHSSTGCSEIYQEEAGHNQWLKPPKIYASQQGDGGFAFISNAKYDPVRGGQVLLYFRPPWRRTISLNLENLIVDRIVAWDQILHTTFVLGSGITERQMRHLYEIRSSESGHEIECITCRRSSENCNFVDTNFEPQHTHFYELQCLGPDIPIVYMVRTSHHASMSTLRHIDEDRRQILQHLTPTVQYIDVKLSDGSHGRVQILLPLSWQNSVYNKLHFPLIVQTLDWNEDEALTDEWRKDWAAYFTVTRQVIYARVSGRERTGHRGSLLFAIEDLITITREILSTLHHVESQEVIIMGKGLGGYLSTLVLAEDDQNTFKCGIAVSPIIDWFRHETSVAERYLGNIKDNHENYVLTKTDNYAHQIKNDTLMVIDSHSFNPLQQFHTMKLSHLLIKAGIRFQQKIYPRASRKMIQYHSYLTLEHFISLCLFGNN